MIPTGNQQVSKKINKAQVLHLVHKQGPISRVELSRLSRLSPSTVSILIEELIDDELIHEMGTVSSGAGRRMTMLKVRPDGGYVLGVDLTHFRCALLDLSGAIIQEEAITRLSGEKDLTDQLPREMESFVQRCGLSWSKIRRIGISIPGLVDESKHKIISASPLLVEQLPLGKRYEEDYGIPVKLMNDLDAAGFAERNNGAAQGIHSLIYLLVDRNVGGGLVIGNQVYRGSRGRAGKVDAFRPFAMEPLAKRLQTSYPDMFESSLSPEDTLSRLGELWEQKLSIAYEEMEGILEGIATYCGGILQLLNPQQLIFDGWIIRNSLVFDRLKEKIAHCEDSHVEPTPVKIAHWGKKGPAIGAATLGLHETFKAVTID
ncbi:putative NBD/HSP70 family sugar kinase [Paenibacillus shirakamiensis]|uniref:NBD/HSP70 family sugar kinase n=1 Tax=Paenibacillus shirakamiensis TaxID=1265935 RepID=A0ABS4JJT5_9BACL|nr:ROK family transcriptional regulator [Paenibacillus shirakamiensis]MBP2001964.1 putative NBD/HSP70 family sugar kinase [Paenibacillus shirakamiensis]